MDELESLRSRVDDVLGDFLGSRLEEVGGKDAGVEREFVVGIADLVLRGGKRLRATLCMLGWAGAGAYVAAGGCGGDSGGASGARGISGAGGVEGAGERDGAIVRASASLELLHACALIHDDVMDRSAIRRGGATLHQGFAVRHARDAWRGDSGQFGVGVAIAAGDLCLVWADKLLRESGLPEAAVERARPVYDAMRAETIRGQYLDLVAQARGGFDLDDALEVARSKTAACTTTGPLCFGGALAGADGRLMAAFEAYGVALGLAFQLRDDLLGAFADPAATGKPSGDDLRDGKGTVLLAEAYQRLDLAGRQRLTWLVGQGTPEAVAELRTLLEECGARGAVEERITVLGKQAVEALGTVSLDGMVQGLLVGLVATVTRG